MKYPYLTTGSEELRFCCPKCGDTKYHLYYNPHKAEGGGLYHCFRCNYSGRGFPLELSSLSLPPIPQTYQEKKKQRAFSWHPISAHPQSVMEAVALDYLQNTRHLSIETIQDYQLSWSPELPLTIVFPIIMNGEPQALQVRHLTKSFAKYVFHPAKPGDDLKKKVLLYNFDKVKEGVSTLYVVEGIFDVLCSDSSCTVCTFGKRVSLEQAELLRSIPKKKLVLAYDTDVKLKELRLSVERLEAFEPVYIKKLPRGQDPADLGPEFIGQPEFEFFEFISS